MSTVGAIWYLAGRLPQADYTVRVPLSALPFRVGRNPNSSLPLPVDAVSWNHAEIFQDATGLWLRDLGSTNGTWVNGTRVREAVPLVRGDLLEFASVEFEVEQESTEPHSRTIQTGGLGDGAEGQRAGHPRALRNVLRDGTVNVVFQPVVTIGDGEVLGYEALGRVDHPELPTGILRLFALANSLGLATELSRLFRARAVEEAAPLRPKLLFLNTHPSETHDESLPDELGRLASRLPGTRILLEVHEAATTDARRMRQLSERLAARGVGLAYDDFGAGQARLGELAEAPPHYLKFDRSLVHNLGGSAPRKRHMVAGLVRLAHELEITTLAEGIETEEERQVCAELGFSLAQGYHLGKPAPAEKWLAG